MSEKDSSNGGAQPPADPGYVVIGKRTEELSCELDDKELAERADFIASTRKRQRTVQQRKAQANAQFNATLKECDEMIDNLAETIKTRKETRPVQCEERAIPELGRATLYRLDTMAEMRVRSLTAKELEKLLGKGAEEKPVGDGKPGEVVDLKVHQGGKGKGKKSKRALKEEAAELAEGEKPAASPTTSPDAASDTPPAAAAPVVEKCPHPQCTAPIDHDGPHLVAEPEAPPPAPETTDDFV